MNRVLFFTFIISSFAANAQAPATKKVIARAPASVPVAKISIEEEAQRILYAKELMNVMDINKTIVQSLETADQYFKQSVDLNKNEKNADVTAKAFIVGQAKFDARKSKLPQQINDQLMNELTQRYTSIELKYLIEITKYPLYKKFRAYFESDDYYVLIGKPYVEARNAVNEAKRNIASEPTSGAKVGKKK